MDQRRLLGIVRFYDAEKGFGFIDTNGYGIDAPDSETKSEHIELFFSYRDLPRSTDIASGKWVSFVYEKGDGNKRDYARKIMFVDYSKEEFDLALNYVDAYSRLIVIETQYNTWNHRSQKRMKSIKILSSFILGSLKDKRNRQHVLDSLLTAYATKSLNVPELLLDLYYQPNHDNVLNIFLIPSGEGLYVKDRIILDSLLGEFSVLLFHQIHDSCSAIAVYLSNFIKHLGKKGIEILRPELLSCFDGTSGANRTREQVSLTSFLYQMPVDSFRVLFGSHDISLSPFLRNLVYQKLNDASFLLNDSMIEYWNSLASENKYPFTFQYQTGASIPEEVGLFISRSDKSNDLLRLWGFVSSSVSECFTTIKDRSVCYSPILLQNLYFIQKFFSLLIN